MIPDEWIEDRVATAKAIQARAKEWHDFTNSLGAYAPAKGFWSFIPSGLRCPHCEPASPDEIAWAHKVLA